MDRLFAYTWVPVGNITSAVARHWLENNIGLEGKVWYTTSGAHGWPTTGWMFESPTDALAFKLAMQ